MLAKIRTAGDSLVRGAGQREVSDVEHLELDFGNETGVEITPIPGGMKVMVVNRSMGGGAVIYHEASNIFQVKVLDVVKLF